MAVGTTSMSNNVYLNLAVGTKLKPKLYISNRTIVDIAGLNSVIS